MLFLREMIASALSQRMKTEVIHFVLSASSPELYNVFRPQSSIRACDGFYRRKGRIYVFRTSFSEIFYLHCFQPRICGCGFHRYLNVIIHAKLLTFLFKSDEIFSCTAHRRLQIREEIVVDIFQAFDISVFAIKI